MNPRSGLFFAMFLVACTPLKNDIAGQDAGVRANDDSGSVDPLDGGLDAPIVDAADAQPPNPCTFPAANDPDFYVDRKATQGVGSPLCPFPNISQALAAARLRTLSNQVIHIAPGTYDASIEGFPLVLRNGVSLVGAGAGVTIIQGSALFSPLDGQYWARDYATIVVGSANAPDSIKNVSIVPDPNLSLSTIRTSGEQIVGIQCDEGTSPGIGQPLPPSSTLVSDVEMGPGFSTDVMILGTAHGCNFSLLHSVLHAGSPLEFSNGIVIAGAGCGGFTSDVFPTGMRIGDGTVAGRNTIEGGTTGNHNGVAIGSIGCISSVTIDNNEIHGGDTGLYLHSEATSDNSVLSFTITNNTFARLGTGIDARTTGSNIVLSDNIFQNAGGNVRAGGYAAALAIGSDDGWYGGRYMNRGFPGLLVARRNQFIGNDVAVWLHGVPTIPFTSASTLDFGNPNTAGKNEFRCNASTGHGDIVVDTPTTGSTRVLLAGNGWDHTTPSEILGSGTAPDGTDIDIASVPAPTVDIGGSYASPVQCPLGDSP